MKKASSLKVFAYLAAISAAGAMAVGQTDDKAPQKPVEKQQEQPKTPGTPEQKEQKKQDRPKVIPPEAQPKKQPKEQPKERAKEQDKAKDDGKGKDGGRGKWRREYGDELRHHPRLAKAIVELQVAKEHMQNAPNDFGGHRAAAIAACDQAIRELRQAIKFDSEHQDEADDKGKDADGKGKDAVKPGRKDGEKEKGKDGEKDKKPGGK